jgi:hypothetical protein
MFRERACELRRIGDLNPGGWLHPTALAVYFPSCWVGGVTSAIVRKRRPGEPGRRASPENRTRMPGRRGVFVRALCAQRGRQPVTPHHPSPPQGPGRGCGQSSSGRCQSDDAPRLCSGPLGKRSGLRRHAVPSRTAVRIPTRRASRGPVERSVPACIECYAFVVHTATGAHPRSPGGKQSGYVPTEAGTAPAVAALELAAARVPTPRLRPSCWGLPPNGRSRLPGPRAHRRGPASGRRRDLPPCLCQRSTRRYTVVWCISQCGGSVSDSDGAHIT